MHPPRSVLVRAGALLAAGLAPHAAVAAHPSEASVELSVAPSAVALATTLAVVPAGSDLVIAGIEAAGRGGRMSVRAASGTLAFSVDVGAEVVRRSGRLVGQSLEVVATGTGYLLVASGEALLFVPDAATRAAIHHRRLDEPDVE